MMAFVSLTNTQLLALAVGLLPAYIAWGLFYNIFLHPLRKFPGPLLWRATYLTQHYYNVKGTLPFEVRKLHKKYGDVVRVSPIQLDFTDPRAWKDIMGHRSDAGGELGKAPQFYMAKGRPVTMSNAPKEEHAILRRELGKGFSDRNMREQMPIVGKYIDLLLQRLHENCEDGKKALNIVHWLNYTTFDIIGDLTFGEPFGCLDNSDLHPWISAIFDGLRIGTILQGANYFPIVQPLVPYLIPKSVKERGATHWELTRQKILKRLEMSMDRPDLMEGLLKKQKELDLSVDKLQANAGSLIIAGSETTATALSGVIYFLLTSDPAKLKTLTEEVRSAFKTEEEIDFTSVNKLSYMLACLNEGMRNYATVPGALPRITPPSGVNICDRFVPGNTLVTVTHWAMYHDERHFADPENFHPERWLGDERFAADDRKAFQPFQVGPRDCMGKNLAYVEMRLILARLIFNFDLSLSENSQGWIAEQKVWILWEKKPLNVYLTPVIRDER